MNEKDITKLKPLIIYCIGDLYVVYAFCIIASFIPSFKGLFISLHNYYDFIPFFSEDMFKAFSAIIILITAYGYLNLKKWGYWSMIIINIFFTFMEPVALIISLFFIVPTIRHFNEKTVKP